MQNFAKKSVHSIDKLLFDKILLILIICNYPYASSPNQMPQTNDTLITTKIPMNSPIKMNFTES